MIDLGGWLDESYRIAQDSDAPSADPPPSDGQDQAH
jgi:endogenous inhibitor of DNA gyrase (YacG/DUF329 family)